MDQLKGAQIDEQDLHRAIVLLSEKNESGGQQCRQEK